ncbi:MAG: hypothetical protein GX609_11805 [Actinomycetales bacterium]|jgi:hypothetical protein|nr:hypothetical protein [Actinomycetales bacterium]
MATPVPVRPTPARRLLAAALAAALGAAFGAGVALAARPGDPVPDGERVPFRPPSVEVVPLAP